MSRHYLGQQKLWLPRPPPYPVTGHPNSGHPGTFDPQDNCMRDDHNNAPSSFYHNSARFQRTNSNEKRPSNRQTNSNKKRPCNRQTKESYQPGHEASNRSHKRNKDIASPMADEDKEEFRCQSYRFPNQDSKSLQKFCLSSLKQKHDEITTAGQTSGLPSKNTDKTNCHEETSIQACSNKHDSSKQNSILTTYDKNGNFIVVSKNNSGVEPASSGNEKKQILQSSSLHRFENNPAEDEVELILINDQGETSGRNKTDFKEKKTVNCLSKDDDQFSNDQSSEQATNHTATSCTDTDSCSDAESEVFDDIFFKTINSEVTNISSEEDESCDEGTISPTFDSSLSPYLEDNVHKPCRDLDLISQVDTTSPSQKTEGDDCSSDVRKDGENCNGEKYSVVNETVCGDASDKLCAKTVLESGDTVNCIDNGEDGCTDAVTKTKIIERSKLSVEKDAGAFLQFDQDSTPSTSLNSDFPKTNNHTVNEIGHPPTEITDNHTVNQIEKSSTEITDNHTENEIDKLSTETSALKMDSVHAIQESGLIDKTAHAPNRVENKPEIGFTSESTPNVDEAINLIRKECRDSVKQSVKLFECMMNGPLKEQKTAKEDDKVSDIIANEANKDRQQTSVENNSVFEPLDENLLQSVNQELHKNKVESKLKSCKNKTRGGDEDGSEDTAEEMRVNNDMKPLGVEDSSTYDQLHSQVLLSKMTGSPFPNHSTNEDIVSKESGTYEIPTSKIKISKTLDLEIPSQMCKASKEPDSEICNMNDIEKPRPKDPGTSETPTSNIEVSKTLVFERPMPMASKDPDSDMCNMDDIQKPKQPSKDIALAQETSMKSTETSKCSISEVCKNFERPSELSKSSEESDSTAEICDIERLHQMSRPIELIGDISIADLDNEVEMCDISGTIELVEDIIMKDPDTSKGSISEAGKPIQLPKASIESESKVENCGAQSQTSTEDNDLTDFSQISMQDGGLTDLSQTSMGDNDLTNLSQTSMDAINLTNLSQTSTEENGLTNLSQTFMEDNGLTNPVASKNSESVIEVSKTVDIEGLRKAFEETSEVPEVVREKNLGLPNSENTGQDSPTHERQATPEVASETIDYKDSEMKRVENSQVLSSQNSAMIEGVTPQTSDVQKETGFENNLECNAIVFKDHEEITVVQQSGNKQETPTVLQQFCNQQETPTVVQQFCNQQETPTVVQRSCNQQETPTVVQQSCNQQNTSTVVQQFCNQQEIPTVVQQSCNQQDTLSVVQQSCNQQETSTVVQQSCNQQETPTVVQQSCNQQDTSTVVQHSCNQQNTSAATDQKTYENQKNDNSAIKKDRAELIENKLSKANEVEDSKLTKTQTAAVISKLLQSNNCSVKHLLLDIFTKNVSPGETKPPDSFQENVFLRSPSSDSVMTDSEYSSSSSEEAYVANLIRRADLLSDSELDSPGHEESDIDIPSLGTEEGDIPLSSELIVVHGNKTETSNDLTQTRTSLDSRSVSNKEMKEVSTNNKDSIKESPKGTCLERKHFTEKPDNKKNVLSRRSGRIKKRVQKDSDLSSKFSSPKVADNLREVFNELGTKDVDKDKNGSLSRDSIKHENDQTKGSQVPALGDEVSDDCLTDDDFHLELSLLDDISNDKSLPDDKVLPENRSLLHDRLLPDEICSSLASTIMRGKSIPAKSPLSTFIQHEVCTLGTSTPNEACSSLGTCIPDEVYSSLGISTEDEMCASLSTSSENSIPDESSVGISRNISSPGSTLSPEQLSRQSSTSTEDASSTSTTLTNSQDGPLKITLYSETDPNTGSTNWTANSIKPTEQIVKKEPSTGYTLRPSKKRKTKDPSPPESTVKKRRITITDLRAGKQSPKSLHNIVKRPLEQYIRTVEQVYRSSEKISKNGLLSISMNDHVSKTNSPDQDGDYLRLSDSDVMYDMVKKAYGESKIKRCRASPRSLYFAAKQGDVLQVLVMAAGCNVNATVPQEKHKTAMHAAATAGHSNVLRILSMVGGNLSSLDTKLQTPLFDAVENQRTDVVKYLISQDVNLNLKDSQGMTVLHIAAQKSHVDIINLLMETRKLDINDQDNGGWTALMWTAEGMRTDVARCLLRWGANVNILDTEQNTCLHWASLSGGTEIMELLLKSNVDIDARNMFGATALHISARERKLPNIRILAKYRPKLDIKNADGKKPLELVQFNSKCYVQLKRMDMLMSFAKHTLKERVITRDIARGQEQRPIPCINEVDDETLPDDFVYVSNNLEGQNQGLDRSLTGCNCSDGCVNDKLCECAQLSARKRFWYDETGRLNSAVFEEDRPLVYECNMKCKCWSSCRQRVVQHGITAGLQLYKTQDKGWAVRTQALIPKGTFVCEYVGEILTDSEANSREDDCYLFDLDVKGQSTLFCLDAKFYGNITRFINHSCDPNVLPVRVFTDHQIKSCPRIAFFAARDIKPYEEVCSNYGEKFWTVKKSVFNCVCQTSKCKYGPCTLLNN